MNLTPSSNLRGPDQHTTSQTTRYPASMIRTPHSMQNGTRNRTTDSVTTPGLYRGVEPQQQKELHSVIRNPSSTVSRRLEDIAVAIFDGLDRIGEGMVSHLELLTALRLRPDLAAALGLPPNFSLDIRTKTKFEAMFPVVKINGDTCVTRAVWVQGVRTLLGGQTDYSLGRDFQDYLARESRSLAIPHHQKLRLRTQSLLSALTEWRTASKQAAESNERLVGQLKAALSITKILERMAMPIYSRTLSHWWSWVLEERYLNERSAYRTWRQSHRKALIFFTPVERMAISHAKRTVRCFFHWWTRQAARLQSLSRKLLRAFTVPCLRWQAAGFRRWAKFSLMFTDISIANKKLSRFRQRSVLLRWQSLGVRAERLVTMRHAAAAILRARFRSVSGATCGVALRRWHAMSHEHSHMESSNLAKKAQAGVRLQTTMGRWRHRRLASAYSSWAMWVLRQGHGAIYAQSLMSRIEKAILRWRRRLLAKAFSVLSHLVLYHSVRNDYQRQLGRRMLERLRTVNFRLVSTSFGRWRTASVATLRKESQSTRVQRIVRKWRKKHQSMAFARWATFIRESALLQAQLGHGLSQMRRFISHLRLRQQASAWSTWLAIIKMTQLRQEAMSHGGSRIRHFVARMCHRKLADAWRTWQALVTESVLANRLEKHRKDFLRHMMLRMLHNQLSQGFATWRGHTARTRASSRNNAHGFKIIRHTLDKCMHTRQLRAFSTWHKTAIHLRNWSHRVTSHITRLDRTLRRFRLVGLSRAWNRWVTEDGVVQLGRTQHALAIQRFEHSLKFMLHSQYARGFNKWRQLLVSLQSDAIHARHVERVFRSLIRRILRLGLLKGWNSWRAFITYSDQLEFERQRATVTLNHLAMDRMFALKHWANRQLLSAWNRWQALVQHFHTRLRRATMQLNHAAMSQSFRMQHEEYQSLVSAWSKWRNAVFEYNRMFGQLSHANSIISHSLYRLMNQKLENAWNKWIDVLAFERQQDHVELISCRTMLKFARRKVAAAWYTWKTNTARIGTRLDRIHKLLSVRIKHWVLLCLFTAWNKWREGVVTFDLRERQTAHAQHIVQHVMGRLLHAQHARAWAQWCKFLKSSASEAHACSVAKALLLKALKRNLYVAWHSWRIATDVHRQSHATSQMRRRHILSTLGVSQRRWYYQSLAAGMQKWKAAVQDHHLQRLHDSTQAAHSHVRDRIMRRFVAITQRFLRRKWFMLWSGHQFTYAIRQDKLSSLLTIMNRCLTHGRTKMLASAWSKWREAKWSHLLLALSTDRMHGSVAKLVQRNARRALANAISIWRHQTLRDVRQVLYRMFHSAKLREERTAVPRAWRIWCSGVLHQLMSEVHQGHLIQKTILHIYRKQLVAGWNTWLAAIHREVAHERLGRRVSRMWSNALRRALHRSWRTWHLAMVEVRQAEQKFVEHAKNMWAQLQKFMKIRLVRAMQSWIRLTHHARLTYNTCKSVIRRWRLIMLAEGWTSWQDHVMVRNQTHNSITRLFRYRKHLLRHDLLRSWNTWVKYTTWQSARHGHRETKAYSMLNSVSVRFHRHKLWRAWSTWRAGLLEVGRREHHSRVAEVLARRKYRSMIRRGFSQWYRYLESWHRVMKVMLRLGRFLDVHIQARIKVFYTIYFYRWAGTIAYTVVSGAAAEKRARAVQHWRVKDMRRAWRQWTQVVRVFNTHELHASRLLARLEAWEFQTLTRAWRKLHGVTWEMKYSHTVKTSTVRLALRVWNGGVMKLYAQVIRTWRRAVHHASACDAKVLHASTAVNHIVKRWCKMALFRAFRVFVKAVQGHLAVAATLTSNLHGYLSRTKVQAFLQWKGFYRTGNIVHHILQIWRLRQLYSSFRLWYECFNVVVPRYSANSTYSREDAKNFVAVVIRRMKSRYILMGFRTWSRNVQMRVQSGERSGSQMRFVKSLLLRAMKLALAIGWSSWVKFITAQNQAAAKKHELEGRVVRLLSSQGRRLTHGAIRTWQDFVDEQIALDAKVSNVVKKLVHIVAFQGFRQWLIQTRLLVEAGALNNEQQMNLGRIYGRWKRQTVYLAFRQWNKYLLGDLEEERGRNHSRDLVGRFIKRLLNARRSAAFSQWTSVLQRGKEYHDSTTLLMKLASDTLKSSKQGAWRCWCHFVTRSALAEIRRLKETLLAKEEELLAKNRRTTRIVLTHGVLRPILESFQIWRGQLSKYKDAHQGNVLASRVITDWVKRSVRNGFVIWRRAAQQQGLQQLTAIRLVRRRYLGKLRDALQTWRGLVAGFERLQQKSHYFMDTIRFSTKRMNLRRMGTVLHKWRVRVLEMKVLERHVKRTCRSMLRQSFRMWQTGIVLKEKQVRRITATFHHLILKARENMRRALNLWQTALEQHKAVGGTLISLMTQTSKVKVIDAFQRLRSHSQTMNGQCKAVFTALKKLCANKKAGAFKTWCHIIKLSRACAFLILRAERRRAEMETQVFYRWRKFFFGKFIEEMELEREKDRAMNKLDRVLRRLVMSAELAILRRLKFWRLKIRELKFSDRLRQKEEQLAEEARTKEQQLAMVNLQGAVYRIFPNVMYRRKVSSWELWRLVVWSPYGKGTKERPSIFTPAFVRYCEHQGISEKEARSLAKLFAIFDHDRSGWIHLSSLVPFLQRINPNWTAQDLSHITDCFRTTRSARVSFLSILLWYGNVKPS